MPPSATQSALSGLCYLTSLSGHCLLSSLHTFTHVWFILSLGNIHVSSPAKGKHSPEAREKWRTLLYILSWMQRPWRLLAAGNVSGELHFMSPWIWVRRIASTWLLQRLLEIVPSGVEHEEGAQISEPGIVALKLKDLMCEGRRHSQTYPRQCKSSILSVPNPGQEKRSSSLLSIKKQSSDSLRGTNLFPVYEDLAWFCVVSSDCRVRSVVVYHPCLTGSNQKPLQIWSRDTTQGRGQAEQVWVDELETPTALDREPWFMRYLFGYIIFLQGGWWRDWQEKKMSVTIEGLCKLYHLFE